MKRLAATSLTLTLALFGCGPADPTGPSPTPGSSSGSYRPDGEELKAFDAQVRDAVLAVPGVSGGTVSVSRTDFSFYIRCQLEGPGSAKDDLSGTLDSVLREIVAQTSELDGAMVYCNIANAGGRMSMADLGISPSTLRTLRDHYS